jgi:hypothetical protein
MFWEAGTKNTTKTASKSPAISRCVVIKKDNRFDE